MRKSTFASLLILCGSTAAIAQVTTPQTDPTMQSNTIDNTTLGSPVPQTTGPTNPVPTTPTDPTRPTDSQAPTTDDTTPPDTTGTTPGTPGGTTPPGTTPR
ncbi:hypothetical protein [Sphingomonas sp. VNH70]|uniref:hypothetical protein n=1 Tax=Sphingomonas silueang TaxID=3156617 RepID=UPI0032B5F4DA